MTTEGKKDKFPAAVQKVGKKLPVRLSDKLVGKRIKELRVGKGLSQRDISSENLSYAYISRIEAGARTPSLKAIFKLAFLLDTTPQYLAWGHGEAKRSDEQAEWIDLLLGGLTGEDRESLLEAAFEMAQAEADRDEAFRLLGRR